MEIGISLVTEQLHAMEGRVHSNETKGIKQVLNEKNMIFSDLESLNHSIFYLSRECIKTLMDCTKEIDSMVQDVNNVEGKLQFIKDEVGQKFFQQAPPGNIDSNRPIPLTPTTDPVDVPIPGCSFLISHHCLDGIGLSIDQITSGAKGDGLVRQKMSSEPKIWVRQADFFVMPEDPNVKNGSTSFSELYKIPTPTMEMETIPSSFRVNRS